MNQKTKTLTGLALFTAIIVVLQLLGSFIKFGPFTISLVLTPIVVGAAVYGPKAGAYLGGVFGVVVLIACIAGWDFGGNMLWNANPFLTALICVGKGVLAGLAAGAIYSAVAHKSRMVGTVLAAIACPVVNTGIFLLGLNLLFPQFLADWASAAGADIATYILTGLVGINFLAELVLNIVVSPVIVRIIGARLGTPKALS